MEKHTLHLSQADADQLVAMEKHCFENKRYEFPSGGKKISILLFSHDRRHEFALDIHSGQVDLKKYTFGNRTRSVITLIRVDLRERGRHVNPNNTIITGPHIHRYREGFGDKWAEPLPPEFGNPGNTFQVFQNFMNHCNIVEKPHVTYIRQLFPPDET
ncbi:MAG: hypothetical protein FWC43_05665 [Planctomycetaceae bacterium]|nr:hypothetical protein [Planctomycetaceae bacterium]